MVAVMAALGLRLKSRCCEACRVVRQFSDLVDNTRPGRIGRGTASYGTSSSSDYGASGRMSLASLVQMYLLVLRRYRVKGTASTLRNGLRVA